jgi:hypothetical protein
VQRKRQFTCDHGHRANFISRAIAVIASAATDLLLRCCAQNGE